jgi:tRNA(adenine34) deaminase
MMQRAIGLARRAFDAGEVPVGAVVYETLSGRVVGEGRNAREHGHDPSAHAEVLAITRAAKALGSWRLDACTLVVTLEPCAMCAGLIVNARLGRVVFGAPDAKAGFAGSLGNLLDDPRLNHRVPTVGGVCAEASSELLRDFFAAARGADRKLKEHKRARTPRG